MGPSLICSLFSGTGAFVGFPVKANLSYATKGELIWNNSAMRKVRLSTLRHSPGCPDKRTLHPLFGCLTWINRC